MFRERSSHRRGSILAPATSQDVLRVFAALEEFSEFEATEGLIGNGGSNRGQAATDEFKGRDTTVPVSEDADDADSSVSESTKQLQAAYKRIDTFSICMPVPSQILCGVTACIGFLYVRVQIARVSAGWVSSSRGKMLLHRRPSNRSTVHLSGSLDRHWDSSQGARGGCERSWDFPLLKRLRSRYSQRSGTSSTPWERRYFVNDLDI